MLPVTTEAASFEVVAGELSFPTSITFDAEGSLIVAESGLPWDGAPAGGRIWRYKHNQNRSLIADGLRHPVNGVAWHLNALYVSEGGHPGRISRFLPNGSRQTILNDLPGPGNYHTNMVAFGPDQKLYFSQGAMTNTGMIGLDAYELGWLRRLPHQHDLPGLDIVLTGSNVVTENPLSRTNGNNRNGGGGRDRKATTGAFCPFGVSSEAGQRVKAHLPCTAAVMRCNPDGSELELVAWGLRNAYGLGFLPDGRLLATDQGADDRGSRPVGAAPDLLHHVKLGAWYGWPDFIGTKPITSPSFRAAHGKSPGFVLANHRDLPPPEPPLLRFPTHTGAVKFAVLPESHPLWPGHLIVALFGDEVPMTAPSGPKAGRCLVRVDPNDWTLHPFPTPPLQRPIDLCIGPHDGSLYILDFGSFEMDGPNGLAAIAQTGRVLKMPLAT